MDMADPRSLIDTYSVYIDGQWVDPDRVAGAGGRYDDVCPATEAVIASAPDPSQAQVDSAIAAARNAFDSRLWADAGPEQRAGFLNQLGEALLAHADEFFALAQQEWGCTANERVIHVEGPAFAALNAAELATHPMEEPIDAFGAAGKTPLRYEPLGVVSILTPWNFPHTLNVMKVCAALAAGNTVVPPTDIESSKLLTVDPRIDMVSFTGSSVVGREVMAAAGATMKRLLLECGGKSASIVLDDVTLDDELLQRMLFESCSFHAGQACILHSRMLLPDAIHDEVVDRLVAMARAVKVGDPTDPDVQMGPLISAAQCERVQAHVDRALNDGAKLATGGGRPAGLDGGYYFEPTILTEVTPDATIAQEEVFGPVLSVLRYHDDDDAVRIANNSQYGLSGAVWGTDVDRGLAIARRVRTGQIAVNGFGPGGAPFGGFNQSGIGRENGGIVGIRQYMEPKAMGLPA